MTQRVERPYDAEVEYLEVNAEGGHACIDTEYVPISADVDIDISFDLLALPTKDSAIMFGTPYVSGKNLYGVYKYAWFKSFLLFGGEVSYVNGNSSTASAGRHYDISIKSKLKEWKVNDTEGNLLGRFNPTLLNDECFQIGGSEGFYFKLYSLGFVENGIQKLHLIPVRVGSEGYMYDRVSGKLFGNSGTGRFILGPDIA